MDNSKKLHPPRILCIAIPKEPAKRRLLFWGLGGYPNRGNCVAAVSSGAVSLDNILATSVRQAPDIDALATSVTGEAAVLLWNHHDDNVHNTGEWLEPASRARAKALKIF